MRHAAGVDDDHVPAVGDFRVPVAEQPFAHRMRVGWERGLRLFFGQTQNPASAHNLEDLGWRRLYTEIDWVRTT